MNLPIKVTVEHSGTGRRTWARFSPKNDFHIMFVFFAFQGETQKVEPPCSGGGGNARALPSAPLFNVICVRCVLAGRALLTSVGYSLQISFFSLRFADPFREPLPARRELISLEARGAQMRREKTSCRRQTQSVERGGRGEGGAWVPGAGHAIARPTPSLTAHAR